MTDDKTFTVADLASRWRCQRQTIYRAINEKRLNAFCVGSREFRITLDEVRRFEKAKAA